jgi:hypothetical protein
MKRNPNRPLIFKFNSTGYAYIELDTMVEVSGGMGEEILPDFETHVRRYVSNPNKLMQYPSSLSIHL